MYIQRLISCLAVAGLAACASTPASRFADSVDAAKQTGQPLVVYMLYLNRPYEGANGTPSISPEARIGFISTTNQEIDRVVFELEAYRKGHPVWDEHGKPLTNELTAMGPIASGADQDMLTQHPIWLTHEFIACAKLTGIHVDYHDGTSADVPKEEVKKYLTPQLSRNCGV